MDPILGAASCFVPSLELACLPELPHKANDKVISPKLIIVFIFFSYFCIITKEHLHNPFQHKFDKFCTQSCLDIPIFVDQYHDKYCI